MEKSDAVGDIAAKVIGFLKSEFDDDTILLDDVASALMNIALKMVIMSGADKDVFLNSIGEVFDEMKRTEDE